jgi:integrase
LGCLPDYLLLNLTKFTLQVRNRLEKNDLKYRLKDTKLSNKKRQNKYKIDPRRWPGVYGYDSGRRNYFGKPDTCYYIAFKAHGRLIWEKIGWRSEGYTPQIAAEVRAERVRKVRHGESVKTAKEIAREKWRSDRTLVEIADAYFNSRHGQQIKGRKSDLNRYKRNLKPILGNRRISSLSELDVERIKSSMKTNAPATVYNALELLRRLINYGVKNNLCVPLAFTIEMPRRYNEVTEYLHPEEAKRLLAVLESWPSKDVSHMLKLAMLSGLRRGEIFKLEDRDLDFRQRLIQLRDPKGGPTVSVPMSEPVKKLLSEQIKWRNEKFPGSVFIFPGKNGAMRVSSNAVKKIKAKAGLSKEFRIFHGLRHHFAVTLANSGEYSLDMIGELLTHKSIEMTRRYGQFLPGTKKKASDRAADLLLSQANAGKIQKLSDIENK